jgi:hypothetical protein
VAVAGFNKANGGDTVLQPMSNDEFDELVRRHTNGQ